MPCYNIVTELHALEFARKGWLTSVRSLSYAKNVLVDEEISKIFLVLSQQPGARDGALSFYLFV